MSSLASVGIMNKDYIALSTKYKPWGLIRPEKKKKKKENMEVHPNYTQAVSFTRKGTPQRSQYLYLSVSATEGKEDPTKPIEIGVSGPMTSLSCGAAASVTTVVKVTIDQQPVQSPALPSHVSTLNLVLFTLGLTLVEVCLKHAFGILSQTNGKR